MAYITPKKRKFLVIALSFVIMFLGILLGSYLATQYVGKYLNINVRDLRNPFGFLIWAWTLRGNPEFNPIFHKATGIFIFIVSGSSMGVFLINIFSRVTEKETDVHGSASWATMDDVKKAQLLGNGSGLYIGAWENKLGKKLHYLKHKGQGHILAFAPTRSGKGVGLVVPNLLTWKESVVVYDTKGENWTLTSGWRKNELKSLTIKLDFTSDDGSSASFNPLSEIRIGVKEVRDVQNIAGMIVDPDGKGMDNHWTKSAYNFLVGLILHVLYTAKDKNLNSVVNYLSTPKKGLQEVLKEMRSTNHDPENIRGWVNPITKVSVQTHPIVSSVAQEMLNKSPEEISGIVSTALSYLSIFRDPVIAQNTRVSDFHIKDLMHNDKPVSLYIIVPESDRDRLRPLVRLILKLISSHLLERMEFKDGRVVPRYKHQLLVMLDEFARLKQLQFIEDDLAVSLGYGVTFVIIVQDLGQIYKSYGKEESITGNCHIRIAYAQNKFETARELSVMAGVTTVKKYTKSFSGKLSNLILKNVSEGTQEVQRPLLTPDEIMRLDANVALIYISNMPPIYGKKIRYFKDFELNRRSLISAAMLSDKVHYDVNQYGLPETILYVDVTNERKGDVKIEEEVTELYEVITEIDTEDNFIL